MNNTFLNSRPQYRDPAADAMYLKAEDMIVSRAKTQAHNDALSNLPLTENDFRARFCNPIFSEIQDHLVQHGLTCQNVSGVLLAQKIEKAAKEKVRAIQTTLPDDQARLIALQREAKRITPDRWYNLICILVYIALCLVALAEGTFAYPAFRAIRIPTEFALVAAGGVFIAVWIAAHMGARYIRKANSRLQQLLRIIGIHLCAFIFFFCLGLLRLQALTSEISEPLDSSETVAPSSAPDCTAAWAMCISSFILFSLALYASSVYYKSKEQIRVDQDFKDAMKDIRQLSESINQRTREIIEIESNCQAEQAHALTAYEYAVGHQQRLINLGTRAINLYVQENVKLRTDGLCPECFNNPPRYEYTSVFQHAVRPD